MRNKHPQQPHYGLTHGLTRKGKVVGEKTFPSVRQARKFMRTGK